MDDVREMVVLAEDVLLIVRRPFLTPLQDLELEVAIYTSI